MPFLDGYGCHNTLIFQSLYVLLTIGKFCVTYPLAGTFIYRIAFNGLGWIVNITLYLRTSVLDLFDNRT